MLKRITTFSHFWFLAAGLIAGLLLNVFTFAPFSAADEKEPFDVNVLYDSDLTLNETIQLYHTAMNDLFNNSIAQVVQILSQNKDLTNDAAKEKVLSRISVPENVPEEEIASFCGEQGPNMNVSTYCLARRADTLYENYAEALSLRADELTDLQTQVKTAASAAARKKLIDRELIAAKKAFSGGLAAYQELQTAFLLHMQFEDTKEGLLKYRDRLVEIRKKIDTFPTRFINATTSQCE